jgi:hypothetical protein
VAQLVAEQLLVPAGAAVAAARAALESALFLDERADAVPGLDESFGAQDAERLADGGQAHPEPFDQGCLGRESLAWCEFAVSDFSAECVGGTVVLRRSGAKAVGHGVCTSWP